MAVSSSTDGGSSWVATSLTDIVVALAIDPATPNTLYASTDSDVFKSTDGGDNWIDISQGLITAVSALAIAPTTPTILYAGTGCGVFVLH
jgi:hypothetical protein